MTLDLVPSLSAMKAIGMTCDQEIADIGRGQGNKATIRLGDLVDTATCPDGPS